MRFEEAIVQHSNETLGAILDFLRKSSMNNYFRYNSLEIIELFKTNVNFKELFKAVRTMIIFFNITYCISDNRDKSV